MASRWPQSQNLTSELKSVAQITYCNHACVACFSLHMAFRNSLTVLRKLQDVDLLPQGKTKLCVYVKNKKKFQLNHGPWPWVIWQKQSVVFYRFIFKPLLHLAQNASGPLTLLLFETSSSARWRNKKGSVIF